MASSSVWASSRSRSTGFRTRRRPWQSRSSPSRGAPSRSSPCSCSPRSRRSPRRSTGPRRWTARRRGRSFRYITLPAIKNTLIVVGVLQVIIGLQVFDLLYSLTSGGPGRDTYVLIYAIYTITFEQISLGYGAAITVVLFGIIVAASLLILLAFADPAAAGRSRQRWTRRSDMAAASARTSLRLDPAASRAVRPSGGRSGGGPPEEALAAAVGGGQRRVRPWRDPALVLLRRARSSGWSSPASSRSRPSPSSRRPSPSNLWLDGYQIIAERPALARLPRSQPPDGSAHDALRDRPGGPAGLRPGPVRPARQVDDARAPDPRPDGPGDRHGHPGPADLPDPRPDRHRRGARHRQRRVLAAADHLAAAQLLPGGAGLAREGGPDRRLLAPRDAVPGDDPGRPARAWPRRRS